ncbi:hypothetical protein D5086_029887 [Populus alba]|uniref:Uncharacterized protein n=1 Tax=Populus alba TaxID=43335 RepID=A0ACC4AM42_POPAL
MRKDGCRVVMYMCLFRMDLGGLKMWSAVASQQEVGLQIVTVVDLCVIQLCGGGDWWVMRARRGEEKTDRSGGPGGKDSNELRASPPSLHAYLIST